jgi:hypothetical protein
VRRDALNILPAHHNSYDNFPVVGSAGIQRSDCKWIVANSRLQWPASTLRFTWLNLN